MTMALILEKIEILHVYVKATVDGRQVINIWAFMSGEKTTIFFLISLLSHLPIFSFSLHDIE